MTLADKLPALLSLHSTVPAFPPVLETGGSGSDPWVHASSLEQCLNVQPPLCTGHMLRWQLGACWAASCPLTWESSGQGLGTGNVKCGGS